MKHRHILQAAASLSAVAAALALGATAATANTAKAAKAKPVTVTVRVEGLKKTLLQSKKVTLQPGWVKRRGHKCSKQTVQGALSVATKGRWAGPWSTEFGAEWEIYTILGETHTFSSNYWDVVVNNVAASAGACQVPLKSGAKVLFAAISANEYGADAIGVRAPKTVVKGHSLRVHVYYYNLNGKRKVLPGATVALTGQTVRTNGKGIAVIEATKTGRRTVFVHKTGDIRDESTVMVKR